MSNVSLGTATFYITGNASGATNAANQANNALAQLSSSVGNNWWGLRNLGLAFAALPSAIAAGAGVAIKSAIAWEDSMFELSRTMGDTDAAVNAVGDSIIEIARRVPLATTELAHLAAVGAQLGIANDSLDTFAETMGLLISSTNLTEANVGDLARIMNVMQIPEEDMERFANTILEVGRNTAATEADIANIARRMSGAAGVAGMTTQQLLGISAAILSLGPRAEAGGTAFNKTISDMTNAVANGSDELEVFAAVSNQTVDEFVTLFREDASAAFARFITGLTRLEGGAESAYQALGALGITEARQQAALLQLSQGTQDVGNQQRDLNAILGLTNNAWGNSNALQDIAADKAKTISGQIQLLKNAIFETGSVLGKYLLPFLAFGIQRLLDFLAGVQAMPGPLKAVVGIMVLLASGLLAAGAAFLLFAPRAAQAWDALQRLTGGAAGANSQLRGTGPAASGSVGGVSALTQAVINLTIALMRAEGASYNAMVAVMNLGNAGQRANIANSANGAAAGLGNLGKQGSKFAKGAGIVTLALTALTIGTTIFGNKTRQSASAADASKKAQDDLKKSINAQNEAAKKATLGADEFGDAEDELGQKSEKANKALKKQIELLTQIAQAVTSLIDAEAQQRQSQRALIDAQLEYQRALERQKNIANEIRGAEAELMEARLDAVDAERELADAEEAVGEAREIGIRRLQEAEFDLADSRDSQVDALEKVADMEERVNDLRSGNITLELIRQTNELRDAQLRLMRAETTVADAEFHLQMLREEGASARDISDAELMLAEARAAQADASADAAEEQEKLNDLQNGNALADAERDLAKARRDAKRAADEIIDKERELLEAREAVANDTDYLAAQRDVAEAQKRVSDALKQVQQAQQELDAIRGGSIEREVIKAQDDLEAAILDVAKANMEVTRQMALARGETFDAADAAHALGAELANLANLAPTQEAIDRLKNFAGALSGTKNIPDAPEESGSGFNPKSLGFDPAATADSVLGALDDAMEERAKETKKKTEFSIGNAIGGGISGALTGASIGSFFGPWGTAIGGIVGFLIGGLVGGFGAEGAWDKVKGVIGKGLEWATSGSGWEKMLKQSAIRLINPFMGTLVTAYDLKDSSVGKAVTGFFKGIFGIHEDRLKEFKNIANKYQEGIQASFERASSSLKKSWADDQDISAKGAAAVVTHITTMKDQTITGINEMAEQRIKRIIDLRNRTDAIGKEEADAMIAHVNRDKTESIAATDQRTNEVIAHIQRLRDSGVPITDGMVQEMLADMAKLRDDSIGNVADSKKQQENLLLELKNTATRLSKEQKDSIIKDAKEKKDNVIEAAHAEAQKTIDEATRALQGGEMSKTMYRQVVTEARNKERDTIAAAENTATQTINNAKRLADEVPPKMRTAFGSAKEEADKLRQEAGKGRSLDLYSLGWDVFDGLKRGLSDFYDRHIKGFLSSVGNSIGGIISAVTGRKSPSKVLREIGQDIFQGLFLGLQDKERSIQDTARRVAEMLVDTFDADYINGWIKEFEAAQNAASAGINTSLAGDVSAAMARGATTINETLNLDAITTADPAEIVNEYVWAKRVRLRGGRPR